MPISAPPARHGIRRDAVQAESREQQGNRAEEPCQLRHQSFLRQRSVHLIGERTVRQRGAVDSRLPMALATLLVRSAGAPVRGRTLSLAGAKGNPATSNCAIGSTTSPALGRAATSRRHRRRRRRSRSVSVPEASADRPSSSDRVDSGRRTSCARKLRSRSPPEASPCDRIGEIASCNQPRAERVEPSRRNQIAESVVRIHGRDDAAYLDLRSEPASAHGRAMRDCGVEDVRHLEDSGANPFVQRRRVALARFVVLVGLSVTIST